MCTRHGISEKYSARLAYMNKLYIQSQGMFNVCMYITYIEYNIV